MGEPVQAVKGTKVERSGVIENTTIFGTNKQPSVNPEISAASVQVPYARLFVRPGRGPGVKEQAIPARQQEWRPTLVEKPVYLSREKLIRIHAKTNWAAGHVIRLFASRVTEADFNTAMRPEKQPITS